MKLIMPLCSVEIPLVAAELEQKCTVLTHFHWISLSKWNISRFFTLLLEHVDDREITKFNAVSFFLFLRLNWWWMLIFVSDFKELWNFLSSFFGKRRMCNSLFFRRCESTADRVHKFIFFIQQKKTVRFMWVGGKWMNLKLFRRYVVGGGGMLTRSALSSRHFALREREKETTMCWQLAHYGRLS